jgi:hypothetical protein
VKKIFYLSLPFFLYISYGLYLSWFTPFIYEPELEIVNPPGYYDYRGVTHAHTLRSTGSGTPGEVIEAAKEAGLDYLILTDLNDFSQVPKTESYDGRLLVMVAGEYSYIDSHLLYYDAPADKPLSSIGQAQILFNDLLSQKTRSKDDGFLVLAHPFKMRYQWSGPYPEGLDGIEVINLMSIWEKSWLNHKLSTIWSVLIYPFNPQLALYRLYDDPDEELDLWEKLSRRRHTVGFAGTDATAKAITFTNQYFKIPTYYQMFELVSNHVLLRSELTGTWSSDRRKIMNALKNGQFYFALDVLADPKGFVAEASQGDQKFLMGSTLKLTEDLKLYVHLPRKPKVPFEVVITKDGQRFMTSNSQSTTMNVHSPGTYRVVVRVIPTFPLPDGRRWMSWIYTNPFYVR